MRFLELSYGESLNLGDEIQTIATSLCLPEVHGHIDRDRLNEYSGEPATIVLNGWFSSLPENWPPAPSLRPVFVGFHMTEETARHYSHHADYFRRHAPIGCRDQRTAEIVRSWGVEAYTSYCATLTLPRRTKQPTPRRVALVDIQPGLIPRIPANILKRARLVTHEYPQAADHATKRAAALALLDYYRDEVTLVITSRLHCALPCAAIGIPVVFFGQPGNARTAILEDLGIRTYDAEKYRKRHGLRGIAPLFRSIDWHPTPPDVSQVAEGIKAAIGRALSSAA
jgi:hypothetical protein